MKKCLLIICLLFLYSVRTTNAHPGRTDSSGCHTCRTNCSSWGLASGEYHCHQAKSSTPQPVEPVKSHRVEGGVGVTEPAPEYKIPKNEVAKPVVSRVSAPTKQSDKDEEDSSATATVVSAGAVSLLAYSAIKYFKK